MVYQRQLFPTMIPSSLATFRRPYFNKLVPNYQCLLYFTLKQRIKNQINVELHIAIQKNKLDNFKSK
jgi:hypothetical protein